MSRINVAIFEDDGADTGRLLRVATATGSDHANAMLDTGEDWIEITDRVSPDDYYVSAGVLTAKTSLTATWNKTAIDADGVDEAVLSTLPNPTTVVVDTTKFTVTDGSFELSAEDPGDYRVLVDSYKHHREEFTISAT